MNIENLYQDVISKLKLEQRPQVKLTAELVDSLKKHWEEQLKKDFSPAVEKEITKILCILDNTQNRSLEFSDLFMQTFSKVKSHDMIIYLLGASQKHIIEESLRLGNMIPQEYIELLKSYLKNSNAEIIEWTLRNIETMGPLSMRLTNEVLMAKPGIKKFFSKHQKACDDIILLMEQNWKRMRK